MNDFIRVPAILIMAALTVGAFESPAGAQRPQGLARFAVDSVTLRSGERLRGAVLDPSPDGSVRIAVQRNWLKQFRPELYEKTTSSEAEIALKTVRSERDRIRSWYEDRKDSESLTPFLELELDRAERQLKKLAVDPDVASTSQFVVVVVPRNQITSQFIQRPENRLIAAVAWQERLENVERREAEDLVKELRRRGITPADETVDLSKRLPTLPQDDREWAARRAIVEYHFHQPLDFQGMGATVFRTDGKAAEGKMAELLPKLLESQLSSQLEDLLGGDLAALLNEPQRRNANGQAGRRKNDRQDAAINNAGAIAKRERVRGFRLTQLDLSLQTKRVRVVERFVGLMPDGRWQTIWSKTLAEDGSQPRPEVERQIQQDPQVAQALKVISSLGGNAQGKVREAIRFGAATMSAQQAADAEFFGFRDRFIQRLDGPSIRPLKQ